MYSPISGLPEAARVQPPQDSCRQGLIKYPLLKEPTGIQTDLYIFTHKNPLRKQSPPASVMGTTTSPSTAQKTNHKNNPFATNRRSLGPRGLLATGATAPVFAEGYLPVPGP